MLNTDKWIKYSYMCPDCDSSIEYTCNSTFNFPSGDVRRITCVCGQKALQIGQEDVTILPLTKQKEYKMETLAINEASYNPHEIVTYKVIENGVTSYKQEKVTDIEYALDQSRRNYKNLTEKQNAWYTKESQLRTLLNDVFADSGDQETLTQIADIFDVPLTKEVEVTAWVRVDLTVDVDMREGEYDIESLVTDNLNVDSYASEVNVTNFEIDRVEEGAY